MNIEYDLKKSHINSKKHGIALEEAINLEWDMLLAMEDTRYAYGEMRMIGYAPMGQHVYCVIYTDRGNVRRIISLRKANKREVYYYVNHI